MSLNIQNVFKLDVLTERIFDIRRICSFHLYLFFLYIFLVFIFFFLFFLLISIYLFEYIFIYLHSWNNPNEYIWVFKKHGVREKLNLKNAKHILLSKWLFVWLGPAQLQFADWPSYKNKHPK